MLLELICSYRKGDPTENEITEEYTMTREQKIQNILDATKAVLEEMMKNGELTAERAAAILECQNNAIAAVN